MSSDGIANSGISLSARRIMRPFITKEKSPRVTKLTGIEINKKIGLIVWLITANTNAVNNAIHAVPKARVTELKISGTPTFVT